MFSSLAEIRSAETQHAGVWDGGGVCQGLPGWIDFSSWELGKENTISLLGSPFPVSVPLFGADNGSL